jgi:tetrahydromethanopterin S-methyltransferase subunit B
MIQAVILTASWKGVQMSYSRLGLAALCGMVASFAFGFLVLWLVPALFEEAARYAAVFRPEENMFTVMPIGNRCNFHSDPGRDNFRDDISAQSGATEGARFGVLIGLFVVCAFVLHNYVT